MLLILISICCGEGGRWPLLENWNPRPLRSEGTIVPLHNRAKLAKLGRNLLAPLTPFVVLRAICWRYASPLLNSGDKGAAFQIRTVLVLIS